MGRRVDAAGEARDDVHAGLGQLSRQHPRRFEAGAGGAPRSHDGDRRALGEREAAREEDGRRVVDLAEERRVARIGQEKDARARLGEPPFVIPDFMTLALVEQRGDDREVFSRDPGGLFRGQCANRGG